VAFHQGARAHARELGYQLEEFWLAAPGMNGRRMSDILRTRNIRGVLVAPLYDSEQPLDLQWEHFAAATCGGFSLKKPALHRACSHYFHAIKIAWDALTAAGYRRIGLALSADLGQRVAGLWLASLLLEQRGIPAKNRVPPLVTAEWSAPVFMRWFERHRPDVVISFKTVYEWMTAAGLRVPEDSGFALLNMERPNSAGVDEQQPDVGAAAIDLIIEQLNSNQLGLPAKPKIVLVECSWRNGPTIAVQPHASA
jgi:LacI family transcriptional regulator